MAELSFDDLIPAAAPATTSPQDESSAAPSATDLSFDDLIPAAGPTEPMDPRANAVADNGDPVYRGTILPLERNLRTGERSWAVPQMVRDMGTSIRNLVMTPDDIASGKISMYDENGDLNPELTMRAMDAASMIAPVSPATRLAASAGRLARPKPEGLQVAEAGQRLGVDLPRAVTSDSMPIQQLGKTSAQTPIVGTPMRKASQNAVRQLDDAVEILQTGTGQGNAATAGGVARESIGDFVKNTVKKEVGEKYDAVDDLVAPDVKTTLDATAKVAKEITGRRDASNIAEPSKAAGLVEKALSDKDGMSYDGIKGLRTYIGEMLDDPSLRPPEIGERELRSIYGALSEDLRSSALKAGGEKALAAFEEANAFAALKFADRKGLQKVVGKDVSDEAVFSKLMQMAGSKSTADRVNLMRARAAIGDEGWQEISSAAVASLGRDPQGAFSPDRFVTGYGKLSDAGKDILFGKTGSEGVRGALEDIATVSSRFKQLNQYANPSGTGMQTASVAGAFGAALAPLTLLKAAVPAGALSYWLSRPRSAKQIASWAKAYEAAAAKPGTSTNSILAAKGKVLATDLAARYGTPALADKLSDVLSKVGQQPEDQGDENANGEKGKDQRVRSEPRPFDPNQI